MNTKQMQIYSLFRPYLIKKRGRKKVLVRRKGVWSVMKGSVVVVWRECFWRKVNVKNVIGDVGNARRRRNAISVEVGTS